MLGLLVCMAIFPISRSLASPPQIVLVAHLPSPRSIDAVARQLATRLDMQVTISGQGILHPAGSRGFHVYNRRLNFVILPAPVDACSMNEVYDGKTYEIGIVALRVGAANDLPHAERALRDVVASVGGTLSHVQQCHQPIERGE